MKKIKEIYRNNRQLIKGAGLILVGVTVGAVGNALCCKITGGTVLNVVDYVRGDSSTVVDEGTLLWDFDKAVEFINNDTGITKDTVGHVLMSEVGYMQSIGIIKD